MSHFPTITVKFLSLPVYYYFCYRCTAIVRIAAFTLMLVDMYDTRIISTTLCIKIIVMIMAATINRDFIMPHRNNAANITTYRSQSRTAAAAPASPPQAQSD